MKEFDIVRKELKKKKMQDVRVRGLKLETEMGKVKICQIEILCASEDGIVNAL